VSLPSVPRHAHDGRFGDGVMLSENCLKIARVDIEPARDDHVLLSIQQDQEPILLEAADIPRDITMA